MVVINSNIPDLTEVSTGLYTVQFKDNAAEVTEEVAAHIMGLYPGKFDTTSRPPKKKDE